MHLAATAKLQIDLRYPHRSCCPRRSVIEKPCSKKLLPPYPPKAELKLHQTKIPLLNIRRTSVLVDDWEAEFLREWSCRDERKSAEELLDRKKLGVAEDQPKRERWGDLAAVISICYLDLLVSQTHQNPGTYLTTHTLRHIEHTHLKLRHIPH